MASYFFDSSAVVKRYVAELGSAWVQGLTDPTAKNDIYVTSITGVEVVSAVVRQAPPLTPAVLMRGLSDFRQDLLVQYQLISVSEAVVLRAMTLAEKHRLRGYDAVQLAAAVELQTVALTTGLPTLVFVRADNHLNAAANREGLSVDDSNLHP